MQVIPVPTNLARCTPADYALNLSEYEQIDQVTQLTEWPAKVTSDGNVIVIDGLWYDSV